MKDLFLMSANAPIFPLQTALGLLTALSRKPAKQLWIIGETKQRRCRNRE